MPREVKLQIILGDSGSPYPFKCYRIAIDNPFLSFPKFPNSSGVYAFADLSRLRSNNDNDIDLKVLYVGKTYSFEERVIESHEKLEETLKLGATHICIHNEASATKRKHIENDIYDKYDSPCNDISPPNPFS